MKLSRLVAATLLVCASVLPGLNTVAQAKSKAPDPVLTPSIAEKAPGTVDPVWKTKKGKHFHRAGCPGIAKNQVASFSRADAVAAHATPCHICKP